MQESEAEAILIEDLSHIREGARGSEQWTFRQEFEALRREQLRQALDSDPAIPLWDAARSVRGWAPGFTPEYDVQFFRKKLQQIMGSTDQH